MNIITSTIMIVAATMTAILLTPGSNALAQDNASCDAACPVPCYFGTCAPADATYKRALARCDMRSLESVAQLYAGTTSANKARDALGILRSRGYGTSRIGVTPNTSGGGNTQNCTAIVEGGDDGGETSGPCALVNVPVGFRCEVVGGRAELIPSGGLNPVPVPVPSPSPSSQGCGGLIAPAGTRCELDPLGNPYFVESAPPAIPSPTVPVPSRGAYGIASSSWLRGGSGLSGSAFREGTAFPEMVVIPSGSFLMGSASSEVVRNDNEGPQRRITVPGAFAFGRTEVTVGEWRRFIGETGHVMGNSCWTYDDGKAADRSGRTWQSPGYVQGGDHPVVCVSWEDAQAYVSWLNGKVSGSPYRLPSESEWEYGARGGTVTSRYWGADGSSTQQCSHANGYDATSKRINAIDRTASSCDDGHAYTSSVGRYGSNGFGLSDILGNVWEWTDDCYADSYGIQPIDGTSYSEPGCSQRVLRGGSWDDVPGNLRSAGRTKNVPGNRFYNTGFRVARTLTP